MPLALPELVCAGPYWFATCIIELPAWLLAERDRAGGYLCCRASIIGWCCIVMCAGMW